MRFLALAVVLCLVGCGTRVVYVPHGEPMRLAEPVAAKVWTLTEGGKRIKSDNRVTIPEGWYCLPLQTEPAAPVVIEGPKLLPTEPYQP